MLKVGVTYKDKEVKRMFQVLQKRMGNLTPAMKTIGQILESSVQKNFMVGGRYSSPRSLKGGTRKWKALSKVTIAIRKKLGKWPGQILKRSAGGLAAAITSRASKKSVFIGVNKI